MRTPDDIKKGLECRARAYKGECMYACSSCDVYVNGRFSEIFRDAVAYIQQLESTYSQVSKALCGKENATLDEVLKAVDQLKNDLQYTVDAANVMKDEALKLEQRLAQAERERAVLMWDARGCHSCKYIKNGLDKPPCDKCTDEGTGWQWRGVVEENTKEEQQ